MTQRILLLLTCALLAVSCSRLRTDLPAPVASGVKVHEAGWGTSSSDNFHGRSLLKAGWDDTACKTCHAADFSGGSSGVSCFTCHPAYPHDVQFVKAGGRHTDYVRAMNYPLQQCQTCHGQNYTGGAILTVGCESSSCHADANGNLKSPESCNTCHGDFRAAANLQGIAYLLSAAPPKSVFRDTAATVLGVGAHQIHLRADSLGSAKGVKCQECHDVPSSIYEPGHLLTFQRKYAGGLAAVIFKDTLARLVTGNGSNIPLPLYSSPTCAGTYCHGNWVLRKATASAFAQQYVYTDTVMTGAHASPSWVAGSAEGQCSSCHGGSPGVYVPKGHILSELANCVDCHGDVTDASGNILNKAKHINGQIDLRAELGGSVPMR